MSTYPDTHVRGEIGAYRFEIVAEDSMALLSVTVDGAHTLTYHATVGEALRRLSVVIGEG